MKLSKNSLKNDKRNTIWFSDFPSPIFASSMQTKPPITGAQNLETTQEKLSASKPLCLSHFILPTLSILSLCALFTPAPLLLAPYSPCFYTKRHSCNSKPLYLRHILFLFAVGQAQPAPKTSRVIFSCRRLFHNYAPASMRFHAHAILLRVGGWQALACLNILIYFSYQYSVWYILVRNVSAINSWPWEVQIHLDVMYFLDNAATRRLFKGLTLVVTDVSPNVENLVVSLGRIKKQGKHDTYLWSVKAHSMHITVGSLRCCNM